MAPELVNGNDNGHDKVNINLNIHVLRPQNICVSGFPTLPSFHHPTYLASSTRIYLSEVCVLIPSLWH